MFLEEGIESMMDIILEITIGRYLRQNLADYLLVTIDDIIERIGLEVIARKQIDKLAETEST